MRLIDAGPIERELFKEADKEISGNPYEKVRIRAYRRAFEMVLGAPTIQKPFNEPLTLEELREMDGEPVYFDFGGIGEWALVRVREDILLTHKNATCAPAKFVFDCGGNIYRRKPEGPADGG